MLWRTRRPLSLARTPVVDDGLEPPLWQTFISVHLQGRGGALSNEQVVAEELTEGCACSAAAPNY